MPIFSKLFKARAWSRLEEFLSELSSSTAPNRRRPSNGDDTAAVRVKKIPAFVRGMVVTAVEDSCRRNGIGRVTTEELEKIRARMPTPKMFG